MFNGHVPNDIKWSFVMPSIVYYKTYWLIKFGAVRKQRPALMIKHSKEVPAFNSLCYGFLLQRKNALQRLWQSAGINVWFKGFAKKKKTRVVNALYMYATLTYWSVKKQDCDTGSDRIYVPFKQLSAIYALGFCCSWHESAKRIYLKLYVTLSFETCNF